MALPTSNLSVNSIYSLLGVSNGREIFYIGGTLKTITELGILVDKGGLDAIYCPGSTSDARLQNLLTDRKLSYFKGYDPVPKAVYGYLYNSYVVSSGLVAPSGWRVATGTDFYNLWHYLDSNGTRNNNTAGRDLKETGTVYWKYGNTGTNSTGFSGRGGGNREEDGTFHSFGYVGNYWGFNSFDNATYKGVSTLSNSTDTLTSFESGQGSSQMHLKSGVGIRLIKTDSTDPGTLLDYDGNVYDTVKIGTQVWTVQNWKCTKLNNGTSIPTVTDNTAWSNLTTLGKCAYDNDEGYI